MARAKSLQNFLDESGRLLRFPAKKGMQQEALRYLAGKFEKGVVYTERQVNELLEQWHVFHDPATLRRELYDNRFLNRDPYGTAYELAPQDLSGQEE